VPELPEVETVRRRLVPRLEGRVVVAADIADARLTAPEAPGDVAGRLEGAEIERLGRRGKYLLLELDRGVLAVHLRMTGNLRVTPEGAPPPPFTRAELRLDDGTVVHYTDIRRFGTWRLLDHDAAPGWLDARNGPEPLGEGFTTTGLLQALHGRRAPVKAAILDQRVVAGLGNIYADEALWRARVHPATAAGAVGRTRVTALHGAIREVLQQGIDAQGATIRDFRTPDGGYGSAQERLDAYGRAGKPCVRCGTSLTRIVVGGRGTHFCRRCQQAPRRRRPRAVAAC
jgi:formamidopyrimidine-DNA glycosylase